MNFNFLEKVINLMKSSMLFLFDFIFKLFQLLFKDEISWAFAQIPLKAKVIIALTILVYFTYTYVKSKHPNDKVP